MSSDSLLQSATQVAMIATDLNGRITTFNSGAEYLLGYHANDVIGKETPLLFLLPEQIKAHEETLAAATGEQLKGFDIFKEPVIQGLYETQRWECRHKNDETFHAQISVSPIHTPEGETSGLLFIITQLSRAQQASSAEPHELLYMTLNDLPDQRQFEYIADIELRRMRREEKPLSIIKISIDAFHAFQETYHKEKAEYCLQKIAYVLAHRIRRAGDFLAYCGANQFAIVLPKTDKNGTVKVAEQLRLLIADLKIEHVTSKIAPHMTISLGMTSSTPDRNATAAMLIAKAEAGLQQAQHDGGNCTRIGE